MDSQREQTINFHSLRLVQLEQHELDRVERFVQVLEKEGRSSRQGKEYGQESINYKRVGFLAEFAFAKCYGLVPSFEQNLSGDDGVDFLINNIPIDVKGSFYRNGCIVISDYYYQQKDGHGVFVLVEKHAEYEWNVRGWCLWCEFANGHHRGILKEGAETANFLHHTELRPMWQLENRLGLKRKFI